MDAITKETELNETTRLKIGYIGIGNAGSQIGIKMVNYMPSFIVNTSFKDLRNEIIPANIQSYLIEDPEGKGRGAGGSRDIAKVLMSDSGILTETTFRDYVEEKEVLIVGASTAGGTGSGIAPTMIYSLKEMYPNKTIVGLLIIPRESESTNCQYNTAECTDEIRNLDVPYIMYDLNKSKKSNDEVFEEIGKQIADDISLYVGSMAAITEHGMIDERDLLTAISYPGLTVISKKSNIDLDKLKEGGIQQLIINNIKSSYMVQPQKDKISQYFALYIEVPEELEDSIKKSDFTLLEETFGKPWRIFLNYSVVEKSTAAFGFIASGLSFPIDRLNTCMEIVKDFNSKRKSRDYSQSEEIDEMAHLATASMNNFDKLVGNAQSAPAKSVSEVKKVPDFLKSRTKR